MVVRFHGGPKLPKYDSGRVPLGRDLVSTSSGMALRCCRTLRVGNAATCTTDPLGSHPFACVYAGRRQSQTSLASPRRPECWGCLRPSIPLHRSSHRWSGISPTKCRRAAANISGVGGPSCCSATQCTAPASSCATCESIVCGGAWHPIASTLISQCVCVCGLRLAAGSTRSGKSL